ncbi:MAG: NAD(+) synthase [Bacteroidota bacterium]
MKFSSDLLHLDAGKEIERIAKSIRETLGQKLKRRGAVVGLSGGIDSSVVAALCVRALGKERVLGLHMHEQESSNETRQLSSLIAKSLGIASVDENITPSLEAAGCYRRRDEAIRAMIPDYDGSWKSKIVLPSVVDSDMFRIYSIVARAPDGREITARLNQDAYLTIVAATNFKQRVRKMLEYFHADRLNYAVAGTPNLLEYDQGFFVKNGDGAADFKPIAHLYKTQVFQLAEALGVPADIRSRLPTTDTYSLPQSQEEFYFSLPYDQMDLCLYARNHQLPAAEVAGVLGRTPEQIERVYRDIESKRAVARYLHMAPVGVEDARG